MSELKPLTNADFNSLTGFEFRSLTNQEIALKTRSLVLEERKITIEVLRLLREIERRQIFF